MYLPERITFGTAVINAVFTFIDFDASLILILRKFNMNLKFFLMIFVKGSYINYVIRVCGHTSYLSRAHEQFLLAGVNFYRFIAKNWQFTV